MKRIVALLAVACLLFTGGISYTQVLRMKEEASAASQYTAVLPAEEAAVQIDTVDLGSLYAAYPPEKVIGTVAGRELKWSEYFYFFRSYVLSMESAMLYYTQVGYPVSWDDVYDEASGLTWRDLPALSTEQDIREYSAISAFAAENGFALSAEAEAEVESELLDAAKEALGENATLEEFEAYLVPYYLPLDVYRHMLRTDHLYRQILSERYNAPDDADEETVEQARSAFSADLSEVYNRTVITWSDDFVPPRIP